MDENGILEGLLEFWNISELLTLRELQKVGVPAPRRAHLKALLEHVEASREFLEKAGPPE